MKLSYVDANELRGCFAVSTVVCWSCGLMCGCRQGAEPRCSELVGYTVGQAGP